MKDSFIITKLLIGYRITDLRQINNINVSKTISEIEIEESNRLE